MGIAYLTTLHFLNQRLHDLQRILLKMVSVYCLFLVDIHQIILVDLTHECGLDLLDTLLSEIEFVPPLRYGEIKINFAISPPVSSVF